LRRRLPVIGILLVLSLFGSVSRTEAAPFALVGDGWDGPGLGSADLTFYFGTPTLDFPLDLQHAALITALDAWASVAALTFTETPFAGQPRTIDFNFETSGFPSNVLAFGFFPVPPNPEPIGGDILFNDNFLWELGNVLGPAAFDLELVAVHEIGHASDSITRRPRTL
jgi:Matrixin